VVALAVFVSVQYYPYLISGAPFGEFLPILEEQKAFFNPLLVALYGILLLFAIVRKGLMGL
jgi:hypothetical protein